MTKYTEIALPDITWESGVQNRSMITWVGGPDASEYIGKVVEIITPYGEKRTGYVVGPRKIDLSWPPRR